MNRLKVRNVGIPGYTKDEILIRVDNVQTVLKSKGRADIVVDSILAKPNTEEPYRMAKDASPELLASRRPTLPY